MSTTMSSATESRFNGRTAALHAAGLGEETKVSTRDVAGPHHGRSGKGGGYSHVDVAFVRAAIDFTDIMRLARQEDGFRPAAADKQRGIFMYTMPVASSPIHMMKAKVVMPCKPKEFLRYLELDMRPKWDDHFIRGAVLPETPAFKNAVKAALGGRNSSSSQGQSSFQPPPTDSSGVKNSQQKQRQPVSTADETISLASSTTPRPQQDGGLSTPSVWLKYMAFKSPMPIVVTKRDFEFVAAEHIFPNGTAVLKAISPPVGRCWPEEKNFVRGFIEVSGFVAEPLTESTCRVTYVALVNPRGLVPSAVVNILVGKQTATLAQLQAMIGANNAKRLKGDGSQPNAPSPSPPHSASGAGKTTSSTGGTANRKKAAGGFSSAKASSASQDQGTSLRTFRRSNL